MTQVLIFFSIRRYTADDHIYGVARPANQSARILFHTHLPQYGKLLNIACPTGIQIRNSKLDLDMVQTKPKLDKYRYLYTDHNNQFRFLFNHLDVFIDQKS